MTRVLRALQSFFGFTHDSELEHRLQPISVQIEYYLSDQNLETDKTMRKLVEENPDRWVDTAFIADCQRMKMNKVTQDEIILCAQHSPFLEADPILQRIRSVKPFVSDPRRSYRTISVEGINKDAELDLQRQFFDSIFKDVRAVHPFYKIVDKNLEYSGRTYVELGSEEEAKMAVSHGIAFGDGVLKVQLLSDIEQRTKEQQSKKKERTPQKMRATYKTYEESKPSDDQ